MASTFRFVWDGNVLLHETFKKDNSEHTELTTWVFEGFVPTAKLVNGKAYSIISDHLGTPILAIDSEGNEVWNRQLDIYGRVKREIKASSLGDDVRPFIPFLYQGQYYDFETKLAYNRFRYYSPETGAYISQDPIGLESGEANFYAYVGDNNWLLDVFGLERKRRPVTEFQIAPYQVNSLGIKNDNMEGHELLQSTWLRTNMNEGRKGKIGSINPSIALDKEMHSRITNLQTEYRNSLNVENQTALQNINRNAALTRRGIYEELIKRGWEADNAKEFATDLTNKLRNESINFANQYCTGKTK